MRLLIESLPEHARGLSGMARWLDLNKATCQRVVEGLRSTDGLEAVERMPGPEGLGHVIEQARARGLAARALEGPAAAVKRFADLIEEHGGSQRALVRAIEDSRQASTPQAEFTRAAMEQARREHFEATRKIMGMHCESRVGVMMVHPDPEDPAYLSEAVMSSLGGVRRQAHAVPIIRRFAATADQQAVPIAAGQASDGHVDRLVTQFSSPGLNMITLRSAPTETRVLIDPDRTAPDPLDVTTFHSWRQTQHNPLRFPPHSWVHSMIMGYPVRFLVGELYVHQDLAFASIPSVSVLPSGSIPRVESTPQNDLWYSRLSDMPEIAVLGRGVEHPGTSIPTRVREMARAAFDFAGRNPRDYVAYRLEVRWPVWGCEYRIAFEFRGAQAPEAPAERDATPGRGTAPGA
jgi:hypothetical protein